MASILHITPAAAKRIRELTDNDKQYLRLSVVKSGCSGNRYDLQLVPEPTAGDELVTDNGGTILVDGLSLFMVFGMTIDWKEDKMGRQFTFDNPKEAGRCGCGESFHL